MSLTEKHQAGEPETERVRIYEFVNYIIHLFDVAWFCNTADIGRHFGDRQGLSNLNGPPDTHSRHSWWSLNKKNSETQLEQTSRMPLGFAAFTEHEKWPEKFRPSIPRPHAQSEQEQLVIIQQKKSNTTLQPTSSMRLGFSAITEHEKWPQKFRPSNTTPARAKWIGTDEHEIFRKFHKLNVSQHRWCHHVFRLPLSIKSDLKSSFALSSRTPACAK